MDAKYQSSLRLPKIAGFEWQEPQNEHDRNIFRDILTEGCTILNITSDDERPELAHDFVYTIGFYLNLLHPELLIMGVVGASAGRFMNDLFAYVESGKRIEENHTLRYDFGKGETQLIARLVPEERYFDYLGYACWFYRSLLWKIAPPARHKFPLLQLFRPDTAGKYPWEPGCDSRVKDIQTLVKQPGHNR